MKVLLSIKPEFVKKIFSGEKKFELRKSIFKDKRVSSVVIYASSPLMRIVGEFTIKDILSCEVNKMWDIVRMEAGVSEQFYNSYFKGKHIAFAIQIGKVKRYMTPKTLADYNIRKAPQSFCYLTNNKSKKIK